MPNAATLKKIKYAARVKVLLGKFDKCFLVHADNVGSRQFMDIRAVRFVISRDCKTCH